MGNSEVVNILISGQKDITWFYSNLEKFRTEYDNMFVAFANQEIIEFDPVLNHLIAKLKIKGIDISSVFIEFVSKTKFIL